MNAADARAVPTHTDQIVIVDLKPYPRMKDPRMHRQTTRNGRLFTQRNQTGFPELPILEVSIRAGARVRNMQPSGRKQVMAVRGRFPVTIGGKPAVVEYEPDPDLRDTEQVPLLEEGGIEAFLRREVLPHAADAWYVPDSVKTGYEVSFTRYFYKPQPLRTLEEIRADILALEKETEGLLGEII